MKIFAHKTIYKWAAMLEENLCSIKKEIEKERHRERERAKMTKREEGFSAHEINHTRPANIVFRIIYIYFLIYVIYFFNML